MKFIIFSTLVVFSVYILHCSTAPVSETSMQDEGGDVDLPLDEVQPISVTEDSQMTSMQDEGGDVYLQLDDIELISVTEDSEMAKIRTRRSKPRCSFSCKRGRCKLRCRL
ncbi:hypothetical protein AAFF_G00308140 [Aldrovandia affinis]|uniref:Hepcidin n=1 Tax=Aldrovandia affinis TaxID=143900 RepID=A0AAD7WQQ5_9TELE|nr:hypothetical protein AAFF_G00308140 [Aldrovandia affinis]